MAPRALVGCDGTLRAHQWTGVAVAAAKDRSSCRCTVRAPMALVEAEVAAPFMTKELIEERVT